MQSLRKRNQNDEVTKLKDNVLKLRTRLLEANELSHYRLILVREARQEIHNLRYMCNQQQKQITKLQNINNDLRGQLIRYDQDNQNRVQE